MKSHNTFIKGNQNDRIKQYKCTIIVVKTGFSSMVSEGIKRITAHTIFILQKIKEKTKEDHQNNPHLWLGDRGIRKPIWRLFGIIIRGTIRTKEMIQLFGLFNCHTHTRWVKPAKTVLQRYDTLKLTMKDIKQINYIGKLEK